MTEVCPDATMLNYVNPMAMNTWAMYARYPHIKQVGLCNSVQGTAEELARDLNIDPATLRTVAQVSTIWRFTWNWSAKPPTAVT